VSEVHGLHPSGLRPVGDYPSVSAPNLTAWTRHHCAWPVGAGPDHQTRDRGPGARITSSSPRLRSPQWVWAVTKCLPRPCGTAG
jgi:hypothetical protein